jgi:ATP-binding cassette subfamily C protein CydC
LLLALATPWAAVIFLAAFAIQVWLGAWIGAQVSHAPGEALLIASGRLKQEFQSVAAAAPELRCYGLQERVVDTLMSHDQALGAARERGWSAEGVAGLPQAVLTGLTVAAVLAVSAAAPLPLAALAALAAAVAMEGGAGIARMFDRDGAMCDAVSDRNSFNAVRWSHDDRSRRRGASGADGPIWRWQNALA